MRDEISCTSGGSASFGLQPLSALLTCRTSCVRAASPPLAWRSSATLAAIDLLRLMMISIASSAFWPRDASKFVSSTCSRAVQVALSRVAQCMCIWHTSALSHISLYLCCEPDDLHRFQSNPPHCCLAISLIQLQQTGGCFNQLHTNVDLHYALFVTRLALLQ